MKIAKYSLLNVVLMLVLGACAGDKENKIVPAELVPLKPTIKVQKAWTVGLGKGSDELLLGLAPAGNGARVFAASSDGQVFALDAITGAQKWRAALGKHRQVSGGPGIGGTMVVVGTDDGEVIALSIDNGTELWSTQVSSSVLARPAVGGALVVVRTVDGQLIGLDGTNGEQVWSVDRRVQGLTLRGNSAPVLTADVVLSGFDNGKIAAIDSKTGDVLWEQAVNERRGRNELERLADVDGSIVVNGEDAFVVGFQGRAVLISLLSGQAVWAQDMSSHNTVALDWNQVYVSTASDEVISLDRRTGVTNWKQSQLSHRELSAPAVVGNSVVVGDFDGYLHWLSSVDGSFQARTRVGSSAIIAPPLAMGDMVYVQDDKGKLTAFKKPDLAPK